MEKIILVTGSSRGIGAATGLLAAQRGYTVCINYKTDQDGAASILKQIKRLGGNGMVIQADVSREAEVKEMFEKIIHRYGKIDVLINNAGILHTQMKFIDMSVDRFQNIFENNLLSVFLCAREAVKFMNRSK